MMHTTKEGNCTTLELELELELEVAINVAV